MEQRSADWFQARCGRITASRFADAIAMKEVVTQRANKKENRQKITELRPTDARNTYMREIIAEIMIGASKDQVSSASLNWGKDVEPFAREAYELETGNLVVETGFILHPHHDFIGCSPDGLIGFDGGLEMKCPKDPQVHVKTLLDGMPSEHVGQVQGCMYVTGRKWWDFVSYDPRQKPESRLYVERILRDEEYIKSLDAGLINFWADVQKAIKQITEKVA